MELNGAAIFHSIRDKTEGFAKSYQVEYKKPKMSQTGPPTTSTVAIGIISTFGKIFRGIKTSDIG